MTRDSEEGRLTVLVSFVPDVLSVCRGKGRRPWTVRRDRVRRRGQDSTCILLRTSVRPKYVARKLLGVRSVFGSGLRVGGRDPPGSIGARPRSQPPTPIRCGSLLLLPWVSQGRTPGWRGGVGLVTRPLRTETDITRV